MIQTFTALAEPNRLAIVELLRRGPQPVGAIGARLHMYQPQVSKHLRVLRDAGLVQVEPRAQQRLYALREEPLRELDQWLEQYRALWDERLANLERYLIEMDAEESREPAPVAPTPDPKPRAAKTPSKRSNGLKP
jgi:DNA-binding transcriptional ArsR family regulator